VPPSYQSRVKWTSYAKQQAAQRAKGRGANQGAIDLQRAFVTASREANARTSKQLVALGRWFENNARNGAATQDLHQRILEMGQRSTAASYNQTRKGPSGYRQGSRFSGGKLRRAINSPNFIQATPGQMSFINATHLNNEARQWARLNFGAGERGRASPTARMYPLQISNLVIDAIGLQQGPSPDFLIPVGYVNAQGEFHLGYPPAGQRREDLRIVRRRAGEPGVGLRKQTRGIRATHFLDRGIERISRELWPNYQRFLADLIRDGEVSNVRAVNTVISSSKGRPWG